MTKEEKQNVRVDENAVDIPSDNKNIDLSFVERAKSFDENDLFFA